MLESVSNGSLLFSRISRALSPASRPVDGSGPALVNMPRMRDRSVGLMCESGDGCGAMGEAAADGTDAPDGGLIAFGGSDGTFTPWKYGGSPASMVSAALRA